MIDVQSPVIDFYPVNFDLDLNGKQHDWEAVVLIPLIDEVSPIIELNCNFCRNDFFQL